MQALYKDSATQARLVASNSGEALLFNDAKAANETLGSLHGDPRVNLACLYSRTGGVMGTFTGPDQQNICPSERDARSVFSIQTRHIRQQVVAGGEASIFAFPERNHGTPGSPPGQPNSHIFAQRISNRVVLDLMAHQCKKILEGAPQDSTKSLRLLPRSHIVSNIEQAEWEEAESYKQSRGFKGTPLPG